MPSPNHVCDIYDWKELVEEKGAIRRVRDVEYWGRPYGTIITPGMKPTGPKSPFGRAQRIASGNPVDKPTVRVRKPVSGDSSEPYFNNYDNMTPQEIHPRVNDYKGEQDGGYGPDRTIVGFVRTDALSDMRGNETAPERVEEVLDSIRREGIREPLVVTFNPKTGKMYLGDGNHRLEAAERLGMPWVPVRVNVRRMPWDEDDLDYFKRNGTNVKDAPKKWEDSPWTGMLGEVRWPLDMHPYFLFEPKDTYLDKEIIYDGDQGMLPDMPEPIKRELIGIANEKGRLTEIELGSFSDGSVKPYKPVPIAIKRAPSIAEMSDEQVTITRISSFIYDSDPLGDNGTTFAYALDAHSGNWVSPDKQKFASLVKIAVNEQIVRRIMDHAEKDPSFRAWLDSYPYEEDFQAAVRNMDEDTLERFGLFTAENVPEETKRKVAQWKWLSAAMSGSYSPEYVEKAEIGYRFDPKIAEDFSYREAVVRMLTRKQIDHWASTSGDSDSEAIRMQLAVRDRFELKDQTSVEHLPVSYLENDNNPFRNFFIDAVYENTQDFFRENGITHVNAYRGVAWNPESDSVPDWAVSGGDYQDVRDAINEKTQAEINEFVEQYLGDNWAEVEETALGLLKFRFANWRKGTYNTEDYYYENAPFDPEASTEEEEIAWRETQFEYFKNKFWVPTMEDARSTIAERAGNEWLADGGLGYESVGDTLDEFKPTGELIEVSSQPISSWSTSESLAGDFAGRDEEPYGFVVSGRIPVERIFCTTLTGLGCLGENEIVVLGNTDKLYVES